MKKIIKENDKLVGCWSVYHFISCDSLKKVQTAYDNTTEDIKVWTNLLHDLWLNPKCSIHCHNREENGRSGHPNCTFLSRRSSKRKNQILFQVSDVMINARARAIDSVILLFYRIYLIGQKLVLSVVVILL